MPTTSKFPRLPYLDGQRGVACIAVILHHCVFHGARIGFDHPILDSMARLLSRGYIGVEVFFVLSGFCIAAPMFIDGYSFDVRTYIRSRVKRLYPGYLIIMSLLIVLGVALADGVPGHLPTVFSKPNLMDVLAAITLFHDWGNNAFWTLTIEARWYILLPLVVAIMKQLEKRGLSATLASGLVLLVTAAVSVVYMKATNLKSPLITKATFAIGPVAAYLPVLVFGVVISRHRCTLQRIFTAAPIAYPITLIMLALICTLQLPANPMLITMAKRLLFAGGGAIATFILVMISPIAQRLLEHPFIVHLGKISYTAYLIHLPLIQAFKHIVPSTTMRQPLSFVTYYIALPIILMAISHYAWHLLEAPFLRKPAKSNVDAQP